MTGKELEKVLELADSPEQVIKIFINGLDLIFQEIHNNFHRIEDYPMEEMTMEIMADFIERAETGSMMVNGRNCWAMTQTIRLIRTVFEERGWSWEECGERKLLT